MVTFLKIDAKTERLEKCSGWQQLVLGALDLASYWRTGNFDTDSDSAHDIRVIQYSRV